MNERLLSSTILLTALLASACDVEDPDALGDVDAIVEPVDAPVFRSSTCYDFSGPAPGTQYFNGDFLYTSAATIEMVDYYFGNGVPTDQGVATIKLRQNHLTGGPDSQELRMGQIAARLTPYASTTVVTFNYADFETTAINLAVNGVYEVTDDFMDLNGDSLGGATISVTEQTYPDSDLINGTVTITADPGETIDTFRFGGGEIRVDQVCMQ